MKFSFKPNKLGYAVIVVVIMITAIVLFRKKDTVSQLISKGINYLKEKSWDMVSDQRISTLHPLIIGKAKEFIIRAEKELGIKLRVVSALRSWVEQTALFNQPFDGKDNDHDGQIDEADEKVTNAKAGSSYHNFGLALDVVEIKNGKALWKNPNWSKIAALGKSIGFEWGGDWKSFKDKPHFQYTFGKTLAQLRDLYQSGHRTGDYVNLA
ncbi:MAG: M15 family metallopeptidase [Flavobacteriales bacterium]|nr:M15 family metallopeptidase [Flavobacteriales bacterium]